VMTFSCCSAATAQLTMLAVTRTSISYKWQRNDWHLPPNSALLVIEWLFAAFCNVFSEYMRTKLAIKRYKSYSITFAMICSCPGYLTTMALERIQTGRLFDTSFLAPVDWYK
jgi:hypothetical protein